MCNSKIKYVLTSKHLRRSGREVGLVGPTPEEMSKKLKNTRTQEADWSTQISEV